MLGLLSQTMPQNHVLFEEQRGTGQENEMKSEDHTLFPFTGLFRRHYLLGFFFLFFLFKKWKLCLFIYLLMGIHAWARAQRWRLEDHLPILVLSFYHVGLSTELRLPGLALSTLPAEPSPQLQSNFLNHKLPSFPLDSIPSSWCNTPCRGNRRSSLFVFCVGKEDKWPWTQFFSFLP